MKQEKSKPSKKQLREQEVLMGVIYLYLKLGKHIGSNTLRENGFEHLSPATIRNYFSDLEKQGYLEQAHPSGGRIPTHSAFSLFAKQSLEEKKREEIQWDFPPLEERKVTQYLHRAVEAASKRLHYPLFLSSYRFDHDMITDIKLVSLDASRILCVILTEFGQILTEVLLTEKKISTFSLRRIESFFLWKTKNRSKPVVLSKEEQNLAQQYYNEIMVRYLVHYSNFLDEEIFRTGLSQLLLYPEFGDPMALSSALSLFENNASLRLLSTDCAKKGYLSYFIGKSLSPYSADSTNCAVVASCYRMGATVVGTVGILGPVRMDYPQVFDLLYSLTETISEQLTQAFIKKKITYRFPQSGQTLFPEDQSEYKLLESKENYE